MGYIFESGEGVILGKHGDTNYVYASGEPVPNSGLSEFVFESGTGLGGFGLEDFEGFPDDKNLYSGDTGLFFSASETTTQGDLSGYFEYQGAQNAVYTNEKEPLELGRKYRIDLRSEEGNNVGVLAYTRSDGTGYTIEITPTQSGEFEINEFDFPNRSQNLVTNTRFVTNPATWYTLEFGVIDGTLEADLIDVGESLSTNYQYSDGGGFGFKAGGAGSGLSRYDWLREA